MDCCGSMIKYLFGLVNLVILIGGGTLLGIGISSLVGDGSAFNDLISTELYTGTAILIITAGSFIVIVSFLGCCGAFQESKCLLGTFFCLVLVLFVLTAAGAVTGFVLGGDTIMDSIHDALEDSLQKYSSDDATKKAWDTIQQDFQCCGVDGPIDWLTNPDTCYKDRQREYKNLFHDGCLQEAKDFVKNNSKLFGGIAIGVALFLFLSMIFSCTIMRSIH